ncbi:HutD family protein [Ancylomarina sp.]|uniref:HutD/Ves family protein n=1 Tax=Ancylomarina sp. TaxID=1970196 RepID=UPI00356B18BB
MSFSIISADKFNTINWSGGTSTQLYIYPETADYGLRNFDFRLSTAIVEVKKSDFTSLPSVSRKIMILDGQIEISHKDHYKKELQRFDIDEFEGDWQTSSVGVCTDFNLMTTGKTKSELSSLVLLKKQIEDFPINNDQNKIFIYLYSGKIGFNNEGNDYILNQGELLIIKDSTTNNIRFKANKDSNLIISKIKQ